MGVIFNILLFILCCACVISITIVTYPSKPYTRVKIKNLTPLIMPKICVMTGEPAVETYNIPSFTLTPNYVETHILPLPFSRTGWANYCNQFPSSLKVLNSGIATLTKIPLFGAYLALYIWLLLATIPCGLFAIFEVFVQKKRQPFRIFGATIKENKLYGIDGLMPENDFTKELIRLNTKMDFSEYKKKSLKSEKGKIILLAIILLLLIGFLITIGVITMLKR